MSEILRSVRVRIESSSGRNAGFRIAPSLQGYETCGAGFHRDRDDVVWHTTDRENW